MGNVHEDICFIPCPICGEKTRTKVRSDTILIRHLLYCPKCRTELLVNVRSNLVTVLEALRTSNKRR